MYGRGEYNTSGAFIDKTMDSWGDRIDGMAYDNIDDFLEKYKYKLNDKSNILFY